jgi:hypothetical protein
MITHLVKSLVLLAGAAAPACALRSFPSQPRACGAFVRASADSTIQEACGEDEPLSSLLKLEEDSYINGSCQTFVLHSTRHGKHHYASARNKNVAALLAQYPDIRIMEAIMWRDNWDIVEAIFKALQIPVCFYESRACGRAQWGRGNYAIWTSLFLAFAYQLRFDIPCMMLLEDDVHITNPQLFDQRRSKVHDNSKPWFHKCGRWGECFMTNPAGARAWFESVYNYGVTQHSDNHVMMNVKHSNVHGPSFFKKIAGTNTGDINGSPKVYIDSFNYTPDDVPQLDRLLRMFDASDAENPVVDFPALASKEFKHATFD